MAIMSREQQLSFARGMNDTAAPTEYLPDECELLRNGRLSFDGQTVRRRGGSERLHTSALNSGAQGYGGIEYFTAAGAQQLVVFMGDKMYYSTNEGATWTNPSGATSLTEAFWSLVIIREGAANVLCCSNGGTNSYQWNGSTWATISNIPDDVKYLAVFGNRLWATGHSGITVVASKVGDIDTWASPDGLSIQAQTHDGDAVMTGLYQMGSVLLAFKSESVGYIEGYGFNSLEVETGARGISRSVGCVANRSIQAAGDQGVCWLSKRGVEFYQIGGQVKLVTRQIQNFIDSINWSQIDSTPGLPTALWWPQKHEYWCAVPVSSDQNDYMIVYRPPHGEASQEAHPPALMLHRYAATDNDTLYVDSSGYLTHSTTSDRDEGDTAGGYLITVLSGGQFMAVSASGYLVFASARHDHRAVFLADLTSGAVTTNPISCGFDGFVRQLEKGNTDNSAAGTDDGETIAFSLITRPFLFQQPMRQKKARSIRVSSQQSEAHTMTVRVKADGAEKTLHTVTLAANSKPTTIKARVGAKGIALPVEIASNDDISISAVELAANMLAEPW
jgi:hypothetical protein